jgi:hypothetical protein
MKGVLTGFVASAFLFLGSTAFANDTTATTNTNTTNTTKTSMDHWTCTTNASSAETDADKQADKDMETAKSAADAFKHAADNCRDCTKITCEAQSSDTTSGTTDTTTSSDNDTED